MATNPGGFTERVKQELSRAPLGSAAANRAELAAILHLGGSLHLRGQVGDPDRLRLRLETRSGPVARRSFSLLQTLYELRPELSVRAPSGMRARSTYGVAVTAAAAAVARDLGLVDGEGRPIRGFPRAHSAIREPRIAALRGAFLAGGSVSRPGRPAHLEIPVGNTELAADLAALAEDVVEGNVAVVRGDPVRLAVKSGETIGRLLAAVGASNAFLEWDDHRLRRSLRNEANRLANADAANLRRTIAAASSQTAAVEHLVDEVGWERLDDDLRAVALVRLANPTASLQELADLCNPPLSKSAVHRRLRRLEELAAELRTS